MADSVPKGEQVFCPHKMYDLSPGEKQAMEERRQIRAKFKKEWEFKSTHPYRHGHGGYIFDPAVQRFQSMRAKGFDYFRVTPKSTFWGMALVFGPIVGFATLFEWDRNRKERAYRAGEVPYKDRDWKFVST